MIAAVVLSAGESRRMGCPKALLRVDGKTFLEQIVLDFKASQVDRIVVVLGHRPQEIREKMTHLPVEIVVNAGYLEGQLSSLKVAIHYLERSQPPVDGMFVHLVDQPFLNPALIDEMIERFHSSGKLIVVPRFQGRRGHPVLFGRQLFGELLATPLDQGARVVVQAHLDETLDIETDDERVTKDIDTPDEYRRVFGRDPCPQ